MYGSRLPRCGKPGTGQREIARVTGVDRKSIRRLTREANSPGVATGSEAVIGQVDWVENPPPRPPTAVPKLAMSACETRAAAARERLVGVKFRTLGAFTSHRAHSSLKSNGVVRVRSLARVSAQVSEPNRNSSHQNV